MGTSKVFGEMISREASMMDGASASFVMEEEFASEVRSLGKTSRTHIAIRFAGSS